VELADHAPDVAIDVGAFRVVECDLGLEVDVIELADDVSDRKRYEASNDQLSL